MNAPGRGLAAILGGIGWGIGLVVQGFVGRDWPTEGPVALTLMLAVVGGSWMLAGATVGLTMGAADRLRAPLALLAGLGAMVGAASLLGNYGWIVALPIGSAALMWELGRIGVLGTWMARAHVIAASLVLVVIGLWLANPAILDGPATAVPALSLGVPYGLSWVAIGWSLLRGASVRRRAALA